MADPLHGRISPGEEPGALRSTILRNEAELQRLEHARRQGGGGFLPFLLERVGSLELDPEHRAALTAICNRLIARERLERELGLFLTNADYEFLQQLRSRHPDLGVREEVVCLFVRLGFSNVWIAGRVGIAVRGMESIRYRLHKKLGLRKQQAMKHYLESLACVPRRRRKR